MNALYQELEPGTVVLVDRQHLADPDMPDRRFRCDDGFGLHPYTAGTAIYGAWLIDGRPGRIEGSMIERVAEESDAPVPPPIAGELPE